MIADLIKANRSCRRFDEKHPIASSTPAAPALNSQPSPAQTQWHKGQ